MSLNISNQTPAQYLRHLRQERGLTQEQLAQAIGTNPVVISYFENGKRKIGAPTALRLAQYFNVNPFSFILSDEKNLLAT